jgi:hypothetical protein
MKITRVEYQRTKQVAKFEPEQIRLVVDLNDGDTVAEAVKKCRITVAREFGELPKHYETKALVDHLKETLASVQQQADEVEHGAFE